MPRESSSHTRCLRPLRSRFLRSLSAALLALSARLPTPAQADADPQWIRPDYPRRLVAAVPPQAGATMLVTVFRDEGLDQPSSCAAYDEGGETLPHRVVFAAADRLCVLVGIERRHRDRDITVYYGPGPDPAARSGLKDARPIAVRLQSAPGKGVPDTWSKMLYMLSALRDEGDTAFAADFDEARLSGRRRSAPRRRNRHDGLWLAALRTMILCPREGVHRFALDCRDAGFLLLDGELAASWPGEHPEGIWHEGAPLFLSAGPHRLEVFSCGDPERVVRAGWATPGRADVGPIQADALLTATEARQTRAERIDKTLHPAFTFRVARPYSFRDGAMVFIPVRLRNTTENWISSEVRCRWRFDDGGEAEGDSPLHVFLRPGEHTATLEVADALGFAGVCRQTVDCGFSQPAAQTVSCEIEEVPAVCFPPDAVTPFLRIAGSLREGLRLTAEWELDSPADSTHAAVDGIRLGEKAVSIALPQRSAGAIRAIRWRVKHRGVEIAAGAIRFLIPPFSDLPVSVEGDRLYDPAGERVVLLPYDRAGRNRQPPITQAQAFGHLLCIDDMLAAPDAPAGDGHASFHEILAQRLDGPDRPVVRLATLPLGEESPRAYAPLMKLVRVPAAVTGQTDVVVLSVGLAEILEIGDPALFERRLAALCDLVSTSMKKPLVLATPPPYPPSPEAIRPFAVAVQRVADARQIPVADLFTALRSRKGEKRFYFNEEMPGLSSAGQEMAARVIARALLSP